jgi:hypothetical protein
VLAVTAEHPIDAPVPFLSLPDIAALADFMPENAMTPGDQSGGPWPDRQEAGETIAAAAE